ncbi:fimbria/pilus periplasmic chaperone [Myxococcus sp. QH3KD-4-1]|nr:fimbria/pilus periplasmic chaperone [Myxococcus qinghaiensis]
MKNQSLETTRFQASVHTWAQDEDGRMKLEPTKEVFFFPSMLTLEPGESRPIRVGISSAPRDKERAYRLVVEELPPLAPRPSVMGLKILTRVSIPVFAAPKQKESRVRLEDVDLRQSQFRFRVKNPGTVNFFIRNTRVRGLDARGKKLVEQQKPGWYVLAGDSQVFALDASAEKCRQIRSLELEVETDQGVFRHAGPITAAEPCKPLSPP